MNERRVRSRRHQDDSRKSGMVRNMILLLVGLFIGGYAPIGISMAVSYLNNSTPGPKTMIPLFIISSIGGYYGGKSIEALHQNRFTSWVAPVIVFNCLYGMFLVVASAIIQHPVYIYSTMVFLTFLGIRGAESIITVKNSIKR